MTAEESYIRSVRSAFPVYSTREKRFLQEFRDSVHEHCLHMPNLTVESLTKRFGAPKKVVIEYFDNMDSGLYLALMKRTTYIRIFVISIIVCQIIAIGVLSFWLYKGYTAYCEDSIAFIETSIDVEE